MAGPGPERGEALDVVAVGEAALVGGFALAGVRTCPAETADEVRRWWSAGAERAAVVILTPAAADALGALRLGERAPLSVVLPP